VYEAALLTASGSGLKVHANRDAHVRACVDGNGIAMHILSRCRMAELKLNDGDRISGEFTIEILRP
jgi:translation initiation factor IF-1